MVRRKEEERTNLQLELERRQNLFSKKLLEKGKFPRLLSMGFDSDSNEPAYKNPRLYEQLHQEIEHFAEEHDEYCKSQTFAINEIISEIERIAREVYPDITVRLLAKLLRFFRDRLAHALERC